MKLFGKWHLVKQNLDLIGKDVQLTRDLPIYKRWDKFANRYFGEGEKNTNPKRDIDMRRMGFADGYLACLRDLGILKKKE